MIAVRVGTALLTVVLLVATQPGTDGRAAAGPAPVFAPAPLVRSTAVPDTEVAPPAKRRVGTVRYPQVGSRRYRVAPAGAGAVIGTKGRILRFRVLVERDITNVDPVAVADFIEETLADPRGWTAGGAWRFRRVGPGEPYSFTVFLATPATRDALCKMGYDRYTSCRNGNRVVLNIDRWIRKVPRYRAPLRTYRQYMVNHEVGHLLGHGHELCPGQGRAAPVMLQQTYGLHGCVANPWPFRNGRRYRGPAGAYF
jgi:hypothetical protein